MCVSIRIIIITVCLCASLKLFHSIQIPVHYDNLQENGVEELVNLNWQFHDLVMKSETIYTATNEEAFPDPSAYKGTAKFGDYELRAENKTLLHLWNDIAMPYWYTEVALRVINVVESVGIFIVYKICNYVHDIVNFSVPPLPEMRDMLDILNKIHLKFYQLSIPQKPVEDLISIIDNYISGIELRTEAYDQNFLEECCSFMDRCSYIKSFVFIGDVHPKDQDTNGQILEAQLHFIQMTVNFYFKPLV